MAAKGSVGPTYKLVLRLLEQDGPMTGVEVAEALKIHRNTAGWNLQKAHENGAIHICEYERKIGVKGDWARIYKFGPGRDARLPVVDQSVYQARHYQKRKVVLMARKRVKMDGNNPFGALLCSIPSSSSKAQLQEKTPSPLSPISASETVSLGVSMGSFAWPRPLPSALIASPKRSRSQKQSKSAKG